jgi:GTPase SAR1 family protein
VYDVVRDKKENVLTDQRRFAQLIFKMAAKDYDHLFKLLIIGDSGVGKSSLLVR